MRIILKVFYKLSLIYFGIKKEEIKSSRIKNLGKTKVLYKAKSFSNLLELRGAIKVALKWVDNFEKIIKICSLWKWL